MSDEITPNELAKELSVSPKTLRARLRTMGLRNELEKGKPWHLSREIANKIREYYKVKPKQSIANDSIFRINDKRVFILPAFKIFFRFLSWISILNILRKIIKPLRGSYVAVEIYVVVCLLLIIFFTWIVSYFSFFPLWVLILILISWRLSDIIQTWFNIFWDENPKVLSPPRNLILVLINFVEITIIFAIFAFVNKSLYYPKIPGIISALRYSVGVITTSSYFYEPADIVSGFIYYFEVTLSIVFLVVVITRVLSLFPNKMNKKIT